MSSPVSTAAAALAHLSWSKTSDRAARTAPARAAADERFLRIVDPDGTLPADERAKRAESARKAHYRACAFRSAEVRRAKAAARRAQPDAESA